MRKVNLNIMAVFCIFMMTLAGSAGAVTHYVSPGQSIQAAINDSNDGDEIEVAPGTRLRLRRRPTMRPLISRARRSGSTAAVGRQ